MIISWVYSLNGFRITVVFNCVKVQPKKRFCFIELLIKQNIITLFFESNILISQGILRNHYSLEFPAQLISDRTKYKRKPSGKFKEKKRKQSHDSQRGPKTKKRKRQRGDSNEMPNSSPSERSVCKTGHRATVKRTPVAQARVTSKRPPRGGGGRGGKYS